MADEGKIKELEKRASELEETLSQAEAKEKDYQSRIEELETQAKTAEELQKENEKLKKKIKELQEENKKLQDVVKDLKDQLEAAKQGKDYYYGKDYYPAKEEVDKLKEENEKLKKASEELRSEIETKDGRIAELEKEKHQMETAERTKQRVDHIKQETGLDFSEERIEKIASEVQDLDEEEFKGYVEDLVDTVLASIPKDVIQKMKEVQEEEPELTLAETINKAYKLVSKEEGMESAEKTQSLASLNQDDPESLEEKYSKL